MTDIRADAPGEVPFLFQQSQKRVGGSMGVSLAVHAAVLFANSKTEDAKKEAEQVKRTQLLPEEWALIEGLTAGEPSAKADTPKS